MITQTLKTSIIIFVGIVIAYLSFRVTVWKTSDIYRFAALSEAIVNNPNDTSLIKQRIKTVRKYYGRNVQINDLDSIKLSDIDKYIALGGLDPEILSDKAFLELYENNIESAYHHIKESIKHGGKNYVLLANIDVELGNYAEAIDHLRLNKGYYDNETIAHCYTMLGDFNQAIVYWKKSIEYDRRPDTTYAIENIIVLNIVNKTYLEAIYNLEKHLNSGNYNYWKYKAIIKLKQQEYQEAERLLIEFKNICDNDPLYYFLLHTLYLRTHQTLKAIKYLDTAMTKGFTSSDLIDINLIPAQHRIQYQLVLKRHNSLISSAKGILDNVIKDRESINGNQKARDIVYYRLDVLPLFDNKVNEFIELYQRFNTIHLHKHIK